MRWDPDQYAKFSGERDRPFLDLVARITATEPRRVVDLGCGNGHLTGVLADRWPGATVEGVDSSPEMIASATTPGVSFRVSDIESWQPAVDTDVVVSNAAFQWVPSHRDLLRRWADALPSGAWLAWQVPGNFDQPSHALMRATAATPRWKDQMDGVLRHGDPVDSPEQYATLLLEAGWQVDAWETTYVHVLSGPDPVLEWVRGTGLRPALAALATDADRAEFEAEYADQLRSAYPEGPGGTLFPFRRVFCVGRKP
ncbi:MAG TPA: trans-aconitate 2-methyltransferase [Jatrophihabitantaceae bacterium]|jgi:trans-aconitate 2-methyltransferase